MRKEQRIRDYFFVLLACTLWAFPHGNNIRSWVYIYDGLGRLVNAHMGQLNSGKSAIEADPDVPLARELSWALDSLGHWSGGSAAAGSHILRDDLDGDGNYGESGEADTFFHDAADASNRLDQRDHENGAAVDAIIHDLGGDLVFDGAYFYQYDALHRLIEVRLAGEFDANDFDPETGRVVTDTKGQGGWEDYPEPGEVILRYFYDGLGRLVERRCPVSAQSSDLRIERYYYDGVRRVQELVCEDDCDSEPTFTSLREYVYGPEYVDQFLLQINQPGATTPVVSYVLQDDNYNVVALTNASGVITRQHAFDPYGNLIARDDFPAFGQTSVPATRLGHQGLFVENLATPWSVDLTVVTAPGTADVFYLNRNRIYQPTLGRFMQRDPNATGLMLNTAVLVNGSSPVAQVQSLNIDAALADGANLFLYVGGNPVSNEDPSGLFFGGYLDLLGSMARGVARAYDAYQIAARVSGLVGDIAAGNDIRASLLEMAIDASIDYGGGKAFEAAASGLSSLAVAFRSTNRLERSRLFREAYEATAGRIPRGWVLHHAAPIEFEDFFRFKVKPPINIDDPRWGMPLHPDWHQWLHSSKGFNWNGKWRKFVQDYRDGTTESAVIDFLEDLKDEAGAAFLKEFGN